MQRQQGQFGSLLPLTCQALDLDGTEKRRKGASKNKYGLKEDERKECPGNPPEVLLPIGIKAGRGREGSLLSGYGAWTRLVGCFENIQTSCDLLS